MNTILRFNEEYKRKGAKNKTHPFKQVKNSTPLTKKAPTEVEAFKYTLD